MYFIAPEGCGAYLQVCLDNRMSETNPLSRLEFTNRVAKRAQYEAFEYTLTPEGVTVRNGSHADPENHEYLVTVRDGLPIACTCPADARFDGACKHRVAVAIRRPLLDALARWTQDRSVATDGGPRFTEQSSTPESPSESESSVESSEESPAESCSDCLDTFPCWECYRTGK